MIIESEATFWTLACVAFVIGVALALIGACFGVAGYIVLRDRGYGTIRSASAITAAMVIVPSAIVWAIFEGTWGDPSPPNDLALLLGLDGAMLGVALVGVLCWAIARVMPEIARRDGGPRRRLRYGFWGIATGVATVPLCVFLWLVGGWEFALRGPAVTVPFMFLLLGLESRARNRIDDADLGAFVLSLRGFADDLKLTIRADPAETRWAQPGNRNWVNLEQFIADEVEKCVGRFVAFGSPRDKLPGGGAGRIYAPEAQWRERVESLAVAAQAIVMQVGDSQSLCDELAIIRRRGLATKLFVLTGPAGRSTVVSRRLWRIFSFLAGWSEPTWSCFAVLLRRNGFDEGADDPGPGSVIAFDSHCRRIDVRRGCLTPKEYVQAISDRLDLSEPRIDPGAGTNRAA